MPKNKKKKSKKKKKIKLRKPRNWLAVRAFERSGAGPHESNKYSRKKKHKKETQEEE